MNIASVLLFLLMAFGNSFGQQEQGPSVKQTFKPGDRLHYFITFRGPLKGTPSNVRIIFGLLSEQHKNQVGLPGGWEGNELHPISPTEVEVDSTIPDVMSGNYRLNQIRVSLQGGAERAFNYPTDFKDDITVSVVNDKENPIPDIKSVSPNPPKP